MSTKQGDVVIRKRIPKLVATAAALASVYALAVTVAPVASAEQRIPLPNGLTVILQDPGPDGSRSVRTQGIPRVGDYVTNVINVRFPDGNQFERNIDAANQLSDTFILTRNQVDVSVQACRQFRFSSECTGWGSFKNEAPATKSEQIAGNRVGECEVLGNCRPLKPDEAQKPQPEPKPLEGPLVSSEIVSGGIAVHIKDRSGVDSMCKYTADGWVVRDFSLPANKTHTLNFTIPKGGNWNVSVTCDNGTSTHTSIFF